MSSLYPPLPYSRNGRRKILYFVEKDKKTSCLNNIIIVQKKNVSVCFNVGILVGVVSWLF